MSYKPILFSAPMVQAILDGCKTMTRRVVKAKPPYSQKQLNDRANYRSEEEVAEAAKNGRYSSVGFWTPRDGYVPHRDCPYMAGDILWVRETWNGDWCDHVIYKADGGSAKAAGYSAEPKWRPSIFMPREAARIFLRVTDVRVERLQEISVQDAKDEGIKVHANGCEDGMAFGCYNGDDCVYNRCERPIEHFRDLWNSINAKRGYSWDTNPWVWVISFERCEKPEAT